MFHSLDWWGLMRERCAVSAGSSCWGRRERSLLFWNRAECREFSNAGWMRARFLAAGRAAALPFGLIARFFRRFRKSRESIGSGPRIASGRGCDLLIFFQDIPSSSNF